MPRHNNKPLPAKRRAPPARSPEARENQLIAYATDLAEKQLCEGTASSQVITHYLKLGSTNSRREQELLIEEIKLKRAKTDAITSGKRDDEFYGKVLRALSCYQGKSPGEEDED